MINILEQTDSSEKVKRIERISGRLASKVRFTTPTVLSFRKNISNGKIKEAIAKYNDKYIELRNAVVSAEVAAAEQQARDSVLKDPNAAKEEELRNARIAEDNMIAKITSVDIAKPRIEFLKMSIEALEGRFGTIGKKFGVNVKKQFTPKALSVPILYSKEYRVFFRNGDLYKLADKIKNVDQSIQDQMAPEIPVKVANWRGLFNSISNEKTELNIAMDAIPDPETEEKMDAGQINRTITSEELSHRRMLGQLGDEIQEVRRLQMSSNGLSSPFSAGLSEREYALLGMLSNISGVNEISKKKPKPVKMSNNTEFQNLIDQIVGYKEPISEEEHKQQEKSMEEYYSNPEVSQIIDDLRHKDMLFAFNQPEAYNKVMESERIDNEKKASISTAIDVLDYESDNETDSEDGLPLIDKMVQNNSETITNDVIDSKKQDLILNLESEKKALIEGAIEQAKLLQKQNEYADIVNGAEEQANMLQINNERIEIIEGAEEQARMLIAQNRNADLANGAEEQAKMLIAQNERIDLANGAEEQAKMLIAQNERIDLANGAEEQAKMLIAQNERIDLANGAEEQAKMLIAQNRNADLANGAEEQARMLIAQNERIDLSNGAEEQARMLIAQNEKIDLANGAEEQARILYNKNKEADIKNEEEIRQKKLNAQYERADLILGAYEQALYLQKEINSGLKASISKLDNSSTSEILENKSNTLAGVSSTLTNNSYMPQAKIENHTTTFVINDENMKKAAEEQARLLKAQNDRVDLINGAEEQARLLETQNERIDLANGAEEQALLLQKQNEYADLTNGAIEQALLLQKQNEYADLVIGAEEQAKIIFEKNKNDNIKMPNINKFEIIEKNDRYGNIVSASKPIKLAQNQMNNMIQRVSRNKNRDFSKRREMLNSVKEQLETQDFDFLKYNDNVVTA